ncbi:MAG: hypothetical protein C0502_08420 [Opitutus sp.]|nr:hypothetical protein [Opitutus sp.]
MSSAIRSFAAHHGRPGRAPRDKYRALALPRATGQRAGMNRRGFLRAVGAAAAWCCSRSARAVAAAAASPGVEALLRAALRERRVVRFRYRGLIRWVQPHALGRLRNGRNALLGWQASGASRSTPPPGWRTFLLAQIEDLVVTEVKFAPRPDCDPEKSGLVGVEAGNATGN